MHFLIVLGSLACKIIVHSTTAHKVFYAASLLDYVTYYKAIQTVSGPAKC